MKRSLTWAGLRLNKLKRAGAIELTTCVLCANVVAALGHHFNQVAADTVVDCVGGQILRSMPLLASMSSGADPGSIVMIAVSVIGSTLPTIFPSVLSKLHARSHAEFRRLVLPINKLAGRAPKEDRQWRE
jgi:hypothetical protein